MKPTKVAVAVAALAAVLVGGAVQAGQFQTNSTTIAREVIVTDAQQIVAPQVSYTFSGPVRNPTQDTFFQIQLKLTNGGIWNPPVGAGFPLTAAGAGNGNVALVNNAGLVISTASAVLIDASTIKATFRVPSGPGENNARVVFNAAGTWAAAGTAPTAPAVQPNVADLIKLSGLFTVAGAVVDCDVAIKSMNGAVVQYPNISDPSYTATSPLNDNPASEHLFPGAQNAGPVANFPTNLKVTGTPSVPVAVQDYSALGKLFKYISAAATPNVTASGKTVTLGQVAYTAGASGYDANLANVYGSVPAVVTATANSNAGPVELKDFLVSATGSFAATGRLWLSNAACDDTGYATGAVPSAAGVANATYTTAFAAGAALNVCYGVDGTSVIPTASFAAVQVLEKAPDGLAATATTRFQEQNNSCPATYVVGGGIRIDVRNYASFAKFGKTGPASSVRIINNSETATADLYAQMIYADGTYGAFGRLPDLKPRAVANYSNEALEALMKTAAATSNPFGANAVGYAATGGAAVVGGGVAGVGDRVRIVSTTGTTLRVQSYIALNNTVLNVSDAQGVDFEAAASPNNGRAPTVDAQPASQDAINGLGR